MNMIANLQDYSFMMPMFRHGLVAGKFNQSVIPLDRWLDVRIVERSGSTVWHHRYQA